MIPARSPGITLCSALTDVALACADIYVPPSQIIDTVELYRSNTHPRRLALRFLSWFLLKQDIQSGVAVGNEGAVIAGHDSIEDAMAAMRLYRMYESFKVDGRLDDVMEDLYEEGRRIVSSLFGPWCT